MWSQLGAYGEEGEESASKYHQFAGRPLARDSENDLLLFKPQLSTLSNGHLWHTEQTSQVLECWPGFFSLQPPSLGQSIHCKPSDVCLQKLAPWSGPGMVAGRPCGEDRRRWCPFYLLTCAIFSGAPCTLASVLSQDAFDGRLFFSWLHLLWFL